MPHFSLSGRMRVSTPACRIHSSARDGSGADSSFFSSVQTRSADSWSSPSFSRAQAFSAVGIRPAGAVPGEEAEEAQDAQEILADAHLGIADEADRAAVEIGKPADQIDDRAVGRRIERVDREVAPLGVAPPVAAEAHLGAAAVGLDVVAQRRHLDTACRRRPP